MERKELVQMHIDRLIHYPEYQEAFLKFAANYPLIESYSGGYLKVSKPDKLPENPRFTELKNTINTRRKRCL